MISWRSTPSEKGSATYRQIVDLSVFLSRLNFLMRSVLSADGERRKREKELSATSKKAAAGAENSTSTSAQSLADQASDFFKLLKDELPSPFKTPYRYGEMEEITAEQMEIIKTVMRQKKAAASEHSFQTTPAGYTFEYKWEEIPKPDWKTDPGKFTGADLPPWDWKPTPSTPKPRLSVPGTECYYEIDLSKRRIFVYGPTGVSTEYRVPRKHRLYAFSEDGEPKFRKFAPGEDPDAWWRL